MTEDLDGAAALVARIADELQEPLDLVLLGLEGHPALHLAGQPQQQVRAGARAGEVARLGIGQIDRDLVCDIVAVGPVERVEDVLHEAGVTGEVGQEVVRQGDLVEVRPHIPVCSSITSSAGVRASTAGAGASDAANTRLPTAPPSASAARPRGGDAASARLPTAC